MNEARTSTAARVVAGSTLVVATALLGASLGLLWVRLFATRQATGWDAIAGWTLESATGGRGLEAGCLGDDPALLALVDAVAELAARRCPPPAG